MRASRSDLARKDTATTIATTTTMAAAAAAATAFGDIRASVKIIITERRAPTFTVHTTERKRYRNGIPRKMTKKIKSELYTKCL
jgi:hypothetical protein